MRVLLGRPRGTDSRHWLWTGAADVFQQLSKLLSNRWQIPLALCAVAAAGAALVRLTPPKRPPNVEAALADISAMAKDGAFRHAADAAANLLAAQPPVTKPQQAQLHEMLAAILFQQEVARGRPNPENVKLLIEHDEAAERLGREPTALTRLRLAQAHEWARVPEAAIDAYREVAEGESAPEQRRQALQALVRLMDGNPKHAAEREGFVEELLSDDGVAPTYVAWALLREVDDALAEDDPEKARAALEKHGERLKTSDLKGYIEYMNALLLVHDGRTDEAEPVVRWIDEWLVANSREENRLPGVVHLPALNRWLSAQIHLNEQRPQEALLACDKALNLLGLQHALPYEDQDLYVAATISRGKALCALERHDDAAAAFSEAVARLRRQAADAGPGVARIRKALLSLFEDRYSRNDYDNAIGYLTLAVGMAPEHASTDEQPGQPSELELLERLGRAHEEAATIATNDDLRRAHHRAAGTTLEHGAELAKQDDDRRAGLLWLSAQQFDQAGAQRDAQRVLKVFVETRTADPRLAKALVQLGQTHELNGELREAIGWYSQAIERFPRLEEASRARLLSAGCGIALGGDETANAEALLQGLLEDGSVAPESPLYRDALLALCDLLYNQERYTDAIGRLEGFKSLYPDDAESVRARFLLADAYRRSAVALRDEPPAGASRDSAREEGQSRMRVAAEQFESLLEKLAAGPSPADEEEAWRTYERLALFYRGDCLLDLNEPQTLQEALSTYRQIAARYETEPAALAAQVQIASTLLRLEKPAEAARALERARWLLRNVPERAFAASDDGLSRAEWERYLTAVSSSHLFAELADSGR